MTAEKMTAKQFTKCREELDLTQEGIGEVLDKSERYITYRESDVQPVERVLGFAVLYLLIPKAIRDKYLPKFMR